MTIEEVRSNFTHLEPNSAYFNHASVGPLSKPVRAAIDEHLTDRGGREIDNFPKFLEKNDEAKSSIGVMLNCSPQRIAWNLNVSSSISILANGLNWKPGDRILLNDLEFPSNVYPFLNLKRRGVEVDFVSSENGKLDPEKLKSAITEKTRLLSISLVQFSTGFRSDLEKIGAICREKDVLFSVDAIQGAGVVTIDTENSNIDFLSGGSHKWLMSLLGTGYLYISENLQETISQKNVGWLSVEDAWNLLDYNLLFKPDADRFETGTPNAVGIVALNESLKLFRGFGFKNIEKCIIENSRYLINSLEERGFQPLLSNVPDDNLSGIVSVKFDNPESMLRHLLEHRITVVQREGIIRLSPHFYNTREEIDYVLDVVSDYKNG